MFEKKPDRHEYRQPRGNPETLGRWENEGGSMRSLRASNGTGTKPCAEYAQGEIALLDALPLGVLITNSDGDITYSNPACQTLCSVSESAFLGMNWFKVIDARDRDSIPDGWQQAGEKRQPLTFEVRMITGTGQQIWTRHSIACLVPGQAAGGRIHTIEDISATKAFEQAVKEAREALSRERERARVTLESIGDAVISTDDKGQVTYLNAVAEELTGWSREAACGQAFSRVFHVVDSDSGKAINNPAERAMDSLEIVEIPENCLLLRPDGSELAVEDSAAPILDANGELTGAVIIFRDQKQSREATERMAHLARHDALTGLPNRMAFAEHFDQAINLARRHCNRVGLLFIDLKNFKQVNDSLGHEAGDRLLTSLSRKLTACVRSTDMVCRHGGDEFVVLLSEINQPEDAARVAAKMQAAAARPVRIQGHPVALALSIGISLYPDHGADMETLMHRADTAMYHAKLARRMDYCLYKPGMSPATPDSSIGQVHNVAQPAHRIRLSG